MAKKRFAVLAMLAVVLGTLAAAPAFAQQQQDGVEGALQYRGENSSGVPTYVLVDPETGADSRGGTVYLLEGDYAAQAGIAVVVYGEQEPRGAFTVINDPRIEPVEDCTLTTYPEQPCPPETGAPGDIFTVNFELAVEGTPPADATFFARQAGGPGAQLADPDGDGVYAGSLAFAAESFSEGVPLQIVGGTGTAPDQAGTLRAGEPEYLIKDFGVVAPEDGTFLSAAYSFGEGAGTTGTGGGTTTGIGETTTGGGTTGMGGATTGGGTTPMGEATAADEQYEDGGGTAQAAGIDLNDDGTVSEADGDFAAQTSDEGVAAAPARDALPGTGGAGFLPSTGGLVLPVAGLLAGVPLLLLGGGLLLRGKRLAR